MKTNTVILSVLFVLIASTAYTQNVCYNLQRIWGDGSTHCAFTSLTEFKGTYYCAFREGFSHIFNEKGDADGRIHIISSSDGNKWETAAIIAKEGFDLRDPKLSVTPKGELMVLMGCSLYKNQKLESTSTLVAFSKNGRKYTTPKQVKVTSTAAQDFAWLWRVTWHKGTGYGVSYFKAGDQNKLELLTTKDGQEYKVIKTFDLPDYPNETTVRFAGNDRMLLFVRRESGNRSAMLLSSMPPYTNWEQKELGFFCGGPDAYVLPDGKTLLGGRETHIPSRPKTMIYCDNADGNFHEALILPSLGDNSYPSFLKVGNEIWITYYSCHETAKPSIFLAKIPLTFFSTTRE